MPALFTRTLPIFVVATPTVTLAAGAAAVVAVAAAGVVVAAAGGVVVALVLELLEHAASAIAASAATAKKRILDRRIDRYLFRCLGSPHQYGRSVPPVHRSTHARLPFPPVAHELHGWLGRKLGAWLTRHRRWQRTTASAPYTPPTARSCTASRCGRWVIAGSP